MSVPDNHLTRVGLIHPTMVHKCSLCGQQWVRAHACDGKIESDGSKMRLGGVPDLDPPGRLPTPIPDYVEPPAPDPALDLEMDVMEALARMHERRATIFRMLMVGCGHREIAEKVGMSVSNVIRHVREARRQIQTILFREV